MKRVHIVEARITPAIGDDDAGRIAVVADHTNIDEGLIVENADFGLLRRRLPFERLGLNEVCEHRSGKPNVVVDDAVDHRRGIAFGAFGDFGDFDRKGLAALHFLCRLR